ncbi:hypothetical protein Tco_0813762 [Tanacetum coccineum]
MAGLIMSNQALSLAPWTQRSTREAGFCTNSSHKRSTYVSITDCQAGNPSNYFAIGLNAYGRRAKKGRALKDYYWLISNKPELLISSFEQLAFFEDLSDGECDLSLCDDSPKSHLTFSNPLFDIDDDFTSSDDESFSGEDVPMENFKIFSNPLFDLDEEIISTKVDQIDDEVLDSIDSIPPGIDHFDIESYLLESLLNRKEIDIFPGLDESIPPGIESDDYDSKGDDNSTSLPEFESFYVDYPDSVDSTIDVVEDIPVDVPNILPTHPTLHMDFDFIPSHNDLGSDLNVSSPSGDRNKIYDPVICIEVESTRFLATHSLMIDTYFHFHQKIKTKFSITVFLLQRRNLLLLHHIGIAPDFEASHACGFVLRSLELHILSFIMGI